MLEYSCAMTRPAGGPPQADDFFGPFCIKAKRT
jgi:hypothetical protein